MPITMFAFEEMFHNHIMNSGIKIPEDVENYNREEYIQYYIFMATHCGYKIDTDHLEHNAKLINSIPAEELKMITIKNLIDKGLLYAMGGDIV